MPAFGPSVRQCRFLPLSRPSFVAEGSVGQAGFGLIASHLTGEELGRMEELFAYLMLGLAGDHIICGRAERNERTKWKL